MSDDFEADLAALRSLAVPSAGDDLTGFLVDVEYALGEDAGWEVVSVRADPASPGSVVASARCAREDLASGRARQRIEELWSQFLRYRWAACHRITCLDGGLALEFGTATRPGGLFVHGQIRVRAAFPAGDLDPGDQASEGSS